MRPTSSARTSLTGGPGPERVLVHELDARQVEDDPARGIAELAVQPERPLLGHGRAVDQCRHGPVRRGQLKLQVAQTWVGDIDREHRVLDIDMGIDREAVGRVGPVVGDELIDLQVPVTGPDLVHRVTGQVPGLGEPDRAAAVDVPEPEVVVEKQTGQVDQIGNLNKQYVAWQRKFLK